ncbi:hypothetical protein [Hydrogenimonas thermophila]|uniref:hypothetical protein n=1 Tax=Hydrogenimonas thermophila TaxID=223786 RepID=UPI001C4332D2|nr:hypothetical protein [Hydrogenimonas thermophila]
MAKLIVGLKSHPLTGLRLIALYGMDYSISMIAKELNRTYRAVKEKAYRLKLQGVL